MSKLGAMVSQAEVDAEAGAEASARGHAVEEEEEEEDVALGTPGLRSTGGPLARVPTGLPPKAARKAARKASAAFPPQPKETRASIEDKLEGAVPFEFDSVSSVGIRLQIDSDSLTRRVDVVRVAGLTEHGNATVMGVQVGAELVSVGSPVAGRRGTPVAGLPEPEVRQMAAQRPVTLWLLPPPPDLAAAFASAPTKTPGLRTGKPRAPALPPGRPPDCSSKPQALDAAPPLRAPDAAPRLQVRPPSISAAEAARLSHAEAAPLPLGQAAQMASAEMIELRSPRRVLPTSDIELAPDSSPPSAGVTVTLAPELPPSPPPSPPPTTTSTASASALASSSDPDTGAPSPATPPPLAVAPATAPAKRDTLFGAPAFLLGWFGGGSRSATAVATTASAGGAAGRRSTVKGAPRFVPGRTGVTSGYLLPVARELTIRFDFAEPPPEATMEADCFHLLLLLSVWEETIEVRKQCAFWSVRQQTASLSASKMAAGDKSIADLPDDFGGTGGKARLQGAVAAVRLARGSLVPGEAAQTPASCSSMGTSVSSTSTSEGDERV